jgi:hypothetical protein
MAENVRSLSHCSIAFSSPERGTGVIVGSVTPMRQSIERWWLLELIVVIEGTVVCGGLGRGPERSRVRAGLRIGRGGTGR